MHREYIFPSDDDDAVQIIMLCNDIAGIVFGNVKTNEQVIFDNRVPKIILTDILRPVVGLENCIWLSEQ